MPIEPWSQNPDKNGAKSLTSKHLFEAQYTETRKSVVRKRRKVFFVQTKAPFPGSSLCRHIPGSCSRSTSSVTFLACKGEFEEAGWRWRWRWRWRWHGSIHRLAARIYEFNMSCPTRRPMTHGVRLDSHETTGFCTITWSWNIFGFVWTSCADIPKIHPEPLAHSRKSSNSSSTDLPRPRICSSCIQPENARK
jgi:hypothetical protein